MITTIEKEIAKRWASEVNAILDAAEIKQAEIAREVGMHNVILGRFLHRTKRAAKVPVREAKKINAAIGRLAGNSLRVYLDSYCASDDVTAIERAEYEHSLDASGFFDVKACSPNDVDERIQKLAVRARTKLVRAVGRTRYRRLFNFLHGRVERETHLDEISRIFEAHGISFQDRNEGLGWPKTLVGEPMRFEFVVNNVMAEVNACSRLLQKRGERIPPPLIFEWSTKLRDFYHEMSLARHKDWMLLASEKHSEINCLEERLAIAEAKLREAGIE